MKLLRRSIFFAIIVLLLLPTMSAAQDNPPTASVEILVQGSPIRGSANGMFFDSQDRLYVASVMSSAIYQIDPASGEILDTWGVAEGVLFPDDVTVGPDDTIYFTGIIVGSVGQIAPDGTVTTLATGLPSVNPITVADDGRIFVAQCFGESNGVYEIIREGDPRPILTEQQGCASNGMDVGPDGMLYGPRWFEGSVVKIDPASGEMTPVLEGLGIPAAVKFNAEGMLYVLDTLRGEVVTLNVTTGESRVVATVWPGMDNLAFDSTGRLYISGYIEGSVVELLADGTTRTVIAGGMVTNSGIAVQNDMVCTSGFYGLKAFDTTSGEMQWVSPSHHQFSPVGSPVTVSSDGENLILTSWFDNAVKIWDPITDTPVAEYFDFAVPLNAIRFQEDLIVAELGTNSVVRANGTDPTQRETLVAELAVPAGLAATEDALWVGDWATGTIWQVVKDGAALAEPIAVVTGLSFPEGLAVTPDGLLIVVETGLDRVIAVEPATGEITVLAEALQLSEPGWQGIPIPPTLWFDGVAVDEAGVLYVNADLANVIYRIVR